MKKYLPLLFVLLAFSGCKEKEPEPEKQSLKGTRWSAFSFVSIIDKSNVYQLLYFKSDTELEIYSATEKTKIVGDIAQYTYTYTHPTFTVTLKDGKPYTGEVLDGSIRFNGKEFKKEP